MASVAIIGAGISGLTAGWKLRNAGFDVTVFEKKSMPGGPIRSHHENGWLCEEGPGTLLLVSEHITELINELGLSDEVVHSRPEARKKFIVHNRAPVAVPSSLTGFLRTPLLKTASKLRILKEPFISSAKNDETLADFVRRRLGPEILERFINPLVGGIYAGNPELLSVQHAFPRLFRLEQEHGSLIKGMFKGGPTKDPRRKEIPRNKAHMISFKNGLHTLPKRIVEKAGFVLTETEVTEISHSKNTFWVTHGTNQQEFDMVIYAGTAHSIQNIGLPEELKELSALSEITYPPVHVVSLGFRKDQIRHALDGFGMLVPEAEGLNILGAQFNSSLFDGRVPDDNHVLLTVFTGGMRQPEIARRPDLIEIVLADLHTLLGIEGRPVFTHQKFWPKAIPQYEMGYEKYQKIMKNAETKLPGFYLTGNFRSGISLGDSITGAIMLAEQIVTENA